MYASKEAFIRDNAYLLVHHDPPDLPSLANTPRNAYLVLELANSSRGHRLGVNGLAIDSDNAILYSGGRDGVVCAWDLGLDLSPNAAPISKPLPTTFKAQTLAHTHWINDICLAANNTALVSASSDMMVKVWRPDSAEEGAEPATIGQHADYAKCLASPGPSSDWVASGGLDRKIHLWDLNGGGSKLDIDVRGESVAEKGSVYALACASSGSVIASGSPESTVRLWDPRTGKEVTKFVGHTDVLRSVLISDAGDTVLSASSDSTIKLWSVTAGRCMYTFSMHSQSVWSLFSEDPKLGVFYSGDRAGLVAKTDMRGSLDEMDDGLSLAVARESGGENGGGGILKLVAAGDHIWTATSSSSINRWPNTNLDEVAVPDVWRHHHHHHRHGSVASKHRHSSIHSVTSGQTPPTQGRKDIPSQSFLRLSNTANFPPPLVSRGSDTNTITSLGTRRQATEVLEAGVEPIHHLPEETVEGQCGLLKSKLLNDRRRVLTTDSVGEVVLWDLIRCKPIQNFGKSNIEDAEPTVNTLEAVAPWCSVDVSNGNLTVVLDPFNCFDAEMYADELAADEPFEFREDQRINLGKWILRYLFDKLIDEEVKRDESYRARLNEHVDRRLAQNRANRPASIEIPPAHMNGWRESDSSVTTPRANGSNNPMTPGLGIALATPAPLNSVLENTTSPASPAVNRLSIPGNRPSVDKEDYFSTPIMQADAPKPPATIAVAPETPAENPADAKEKEAANGKSPSTPFGRFRMTFGTKKLGRSASSTAEKPALTEEQKAAATEAGDNSENSSNHEKEVDDCFLGAVQRARNRYDAQLTDQAERYIETQLCPSLSSETPLLKLPAGLKVIIQEETSGGSVEVYRGTIESTGEDTDAIEGKGPLWLGDALLLNQLPVKDPVKISFILHPWQDSLPPIATPDGNNRLNANRMLRVKKILAYVAERIDPQDPENPDPDALKPEEYLELYCNDQLLPHNMSLATLRAHIWKGGNDIVLYYKANGRKEIPIPPPPELEPSESLDTAETAAAAAAEPAASAAAPGTPHPDAQ
ncbi:hypothetical protein MKZ38_010550 [Zalerion maritima]|uniref:WD repeat protein n=1 Tax=Zalerion maritima TaxID=339359 RepID=A0AAD5WMV5_9PEZI|nr:hypothetical protein MKZ38_010550 [Zalerion maritima]